MKNKSNGLKIYLVVTQILVLPSLFFWHGFDYDFANWEWMTLRMKAVSLFMTYFPIPLFLFVIGSWWQVKKRPLLAILLSTIPLVCFIILIVFSVLFTTATFFLTPFPGE